MAEYPVAPAKPIQHTKEAKQTAETMPTGRTARGLKANFNKLMYGPGEAYDKAMAARDVNAGRFTDIKKSQFKKLMDKPGWDKE